MAVLTWNGIGVLVRVLGDQRVLDMTTTNAVSTQQHQSLSLKRWIANWRRNVKEVVTRNGILRQESFITHVELWRLPRKWPSRVDQRPHCAWPCSDRGTVSSSYRRWSSSLEWTRNGDFKLVAFLRSGWTLTEYANSMVQNCRLSCWHIRLITVKIVQEVNCFLLNTIRNKYASHKRNSYRKLIQD